MGVQDTTTPKINNVWCYQCSGLKKLTKIKSSSPVFGEQNAVVINGKAECGDNVNFVATRLQLLEWENRNDRQSGRRNRERLDSNRYRSSD